MADKGQWDKADYKYEEARLRNEVEREQIEIERLEIQKKEIHLKIEALDIKIVKHKEKQESLRDQAQWCRTKLAELENE